MTLARVATSFALPLAGCSATAPATFAPAAQAVSLDAASPAGHQLLVDVTAAALAGIQGAASAVRDYEGLPVAPASATVAQAAALGSGVNRVAAKLAPEVQTLLENARHTAAQQNVHVTTDDLIEALARGFDAVATHAPSAPTHP